MTDKIIFICYLSEINGNAVAGPLPIDIQPIDVAASIIALSAPREIGGCSTRLRARVECISRC